MAASPPEHPGSPSRRRQRDPERKARILSAAAELAARRGFHTIAMSDIGAEAGIVGSGVYRHFASKTAILVALLDQVMSRLQDGAAAVAGRATDDRSALSALVRDHIQVAIEDRSVLAVYHREAHNLPEDDRRRLRRAQRLYLEEWVHVLAPLRPELTDAAPGVGPAVIGPVRPGRAAPRSAAWSPYWPCGPTREPRPGQRP